MPGFVSGAAVTLLAWSVLAIQFVGLGLLLMRTVGLSSGRSAHAFLAFWLGFGLTLAYLQVWSLFWPMSAAALVPLLGLGLVGWALNGRAIVGRVHELGHLKGRWALVLGLCVWGAVYAQAPLTLYDAGLYHLAAIRWASLFAVMPGLGNLSPPFGINSTAFLFISALGAGNVPGFHIALGLLIAVLLLELLSIARLPIGNLDPNGAHPSAYVAALLVLPTLVLAGQAGFSSTMYDVPNYLLTIVMARRLLDLLDGQAHTRSEAFLTVLTLALLGFTAITVKLSIAVFSMTCLAVAIAVAAWGMRPRVPQMVAYFGISAAIALLVLGPWLMRNAILTGYPLYPDPTLRLPFDWSMPQSAVRDYRDLLYDFARVRGPEFTGASRSLSWLFGPWLGMSWRDLIAPLLIALATPLAMLMFSPSAARRVGRGWLFLVPVWLAVVAWFVTAPDPRYAGSLLWLAAATPVALWLPSIHRLARVLLLVAFCAGAEMPNASYLIALVQVPAQVVSGQFADLPDTPREPLTTFTTASGLQVYVPVEGDQIWDAPLPATPYPNPALRLRCPETLECGFAV